MARLFVTDINLNKNELQNARIQGLSSAPLNPVTGQIYYNSSDNKMYYYNGLPSPDGPWVAMSGSNEVIQDVINETLIAGYGLSKDYIDEPGGTLTFSIDTTETADLTTAQTLTNKTLTSPDVSGLNLTDSTITFEGSLDDANQTVLQVTNPTADREITLPDATGTVALVENELGDFAPQTSALSLNSQRITDLAEPVDPQDAATKFYVDSAVAGLTWKKAVNLASTTNIDLTGAIDSLVIDGHSALTATHGNGYRILLTGQTNAIENGIYVYSQDLTGYTLTRSTDADAFAELKGAAVFVMEGSSYGSTSWVQANHYITDFNNQAWEQFAGASEYTAGAGLVADGNVFNVGQGLGITVTANEVAIDTTVTARKYTAVIGNGSATSYVITHNLNNQFVTAQVFQNASPYALVEADVELTSPTQVTVRFALPPATGEYLVTVIG